MASKLPAPKSSHSVKEIATFLESPGDLGVLRLTQLPSPGKCSALCQKLPWGGNEPLGETRDPMEGGWIIPRTDQSAPAAWRGLFWDIFRSGH